MAMISCAVHPASASLRPAALRSPCTTQRFGKPASSQCFLNHAVKLWPGNGRTTSPTHPMTPEVATLAEVTSVAAATIAMRNGPVASPSARLVFGQRHHVEPPAQRDQHDGPNRHRRRGHARAANQQHDVFDRRWDRGWAASNPRDEDLDELGERDGIASRGERDEEPEREQAQRDDEAWEEAASH